MAKVYASPHVIERKDIEIETNLDILDKDTTRVIIMNRSIYADNDQSQKRNGRLRVVSLNKFIENYKRFKTQ